MSENSSENTKCPKCGAPLESDAPEGLCPRCLIALNLATQTELPGERAPHGTKVVKPAPILDDIARHFPQFEILGCLGRGGMGVVYKARQKSLDRLVALKILAPEREKDPQFAGRFAREAKTLAQLNHPSIVTVHDFGEADGMFYLVMEFVDGVNLRQLLAERKLSPEEALAIVPPVCEALQYAHGQGVVHRDIKPENLLLDKQGRIKIADFGIAKIMGTVAQTSLSASSLVGNTQAGKPAPPADLTAVDKVIGTPQYMAPEQTNDPQKVDHRADIYSLGVVLYEMLTGELPASKLQAPSRKVQVDVRIDEIVLRALEQKPEQRYQTAEQFKTMVETVGTPAAKSEVRSPRSADATQGRPKSEEEQRRSTSSAARQHYNPWEPTIVIAGAMLFVVMLIVALEWSGPLRLSLIAINLLGLAICGVSLAGLWPFPSPFFPEPNFSSRNLRRRTGSAAQPDAAIAPPSGGRARGCFFVAGTAFLVWFGLLLLLAIGGIIISLALSALHRAKSNADASNSVVHGMAADSVVASSPADHPVVQVTSGTPAEVQLGRGISLEVVGVLRNPRESDVWLKPDGTVFDVAPADVVQLAQPRTLDSPVQTVEPEDEVFVYYRVHAPDGVSMESIRMKWRPEPRLLQSAGGEFPTVRDSSELRQTVAHFVLREAVPSLDLTVELMASDAVWEAVAEFDGQSTKELLPNAMVVFSPPRFDKKAKRYVIDVMHNVSRKDQTLRLVAHSKGGRQTEIDFHSGVLSGTPTKGFALVYPDEVNVDEIEKWVLERTPWLRGEIKNIALQPRAASTGDAVASSATFDTVQEVTLNDCDVRAEALDFETGRIQVVPEEVRRQLLDTTNADWFVKSGVDLLTDTTRKGVGLMTICSNELMLVKLAEEAWLSLTPAQLTEALDQGVSGLHEEEGYFGKVYVLGPNMPTPLILGFRTGTSTEGILQARWSDGVKQPPLTLRYKLVQRGAASSASTLVPGSTSGAVNFGSPFIARLPAGAIELVALSHYPSTNHPWWAPDGTPAQEGPFVTEAASGGGSTDAYRWFSIVARLHDLPADSSAPAWRLEPRNTLATGKAIATNGSTRGHLAMISTKQPRSAAKATVGVGIASGTWETITKAKAGAIPPLPQSSPYGAVTFLPPSETDDGIRLTATHTINDMELRLAAVEADGTEHVGTDVAQMISGTMGNTAVTFAGLSLKSASQQQVEFQLRVRPYHWVEFRNVSLEPGRRTDVGVVHESAATTPTTLTAPTAKKASPAFGFGDNLLIWHWDMTPEPLTVYVMEDRIFHDPALLLARLAGLHQQKPFSAVPVRLGPADWAESEGRKVVRELENALRGDCPARLAVGEVLSELPLEMDDGLYSVTVPVWDINKNSALNLDDGTLNQTKPPVSLDLSKPETLKAWRGMGFDAYVPPGTDMLMLPTLPATLVPGRDEWEQSEIAPRALMQKIASLALRARDQTDSAARPVTALFANAPTPGWLLTDYGSLLLVKVEKDGDDPEALKVSWRRARQAAQRLSQEDQSSSPDETL